MTQNGVLQKDDNDYPVMGGTSSSDNNTVINSAFDPATRRLLVDASSSVFDLTIEDDLGTSVANVDTIVFDNADVTDDTGGQVTVHVTGLALADGGTGLSSIAAKSIWVANSADILAAVTPGAGQSVRINAGNTAWEAYTPVASGGLSWSEVTGTSQSAAVNSGYIVNNAGLVTVTIPTTAALGDIVRIVGKGAGGWLIAQNASESINLGSLTTTVGVGGSLASTNQFDCIEIICTVANTTWTVMSVQGNITVV